MSESERPEGDMSIAGNFVVADGALMRGNLRCDGHARLGKGVRIEGDVDVAGTMAVRAESRIDGRIVCGGALEWHPSASANGLRCDGGLHVDGVQVASRVEAPEGIGPAEG